MSEDYPYKAKARVTALIESLETSVRASPELDVRGIALPALDAALVDIRAAIPDDPVVQAITNIVERGASDQVRAVDALLVAKQLDAAIGPYPIVIA
jgi:hypothetical protein